MQRPNEHHLDRRNKVLETNMRKKAASSDDDLSQAIASFQAGKFSDAERCFEEVLRHQPKNVVALNLLSVLLSHQKRYIEAEFSYKGGAGRQFELGRDLL